MKKKVACGLTIWVNHFAYRRLDFFLCVVVSLTFVSMESAGGTLKTPLIIQSGITLNDTNN